jgi:hypothetical protein
MRRISEQDEFLLSCLLDGDLPSDQAEALRERMGREPELRAAFASLSRVNDLLVGQRADQPVVDLKALHSSIMQQVERRAARPSILRLPFWVRLAVPLAAAAAVALVVTMQVNRSPRPGAITVAQNNQTVQSIEAPSPAQPIEPSHAAQPAPTGQPSQTAQPAPTVVTPKEKPAPRMLARSDGDATRGRPVVRFNRPSDGPSNSQIHVSYVRSTDLAKAMKARDDERRSRPSWTSYVAEVPKNSRRVVVEDLPPL